MVARATVLGLGFLALVAMPRRAAAQHWPRQHPTLPLSEIIPGALPAPPTPAELGKDERPTRIPDRDDGGFTYDATGFRARVDAEGRVSFHDKSSFQGELVISPLFIALAGTFDATDLIMRWLGEDPYQYEKARFLERTFDERAEMRRRQNVHTMDRALAQLPDYLAAVWSQTAWPTELRRRVLFALWDECAETGDPLVARGGKHARFLIESFIRAELGPASGMGYLPEELAAFDQMRSSSQHFSPYDRPNPPPESESLKTSVAGGAVNHASASVHSGLAMRTGQEQ